MSKRVATTGRHTSARIRTIIAQVLWTVCTIFALVLAAGALCIALDANLANSLVKFILDFADGVDLGVFSRDNGIKDFSGSNADTKNALLNWGLAAIVWLVIGRALERVVRP
ncbi:hypothetical protein [Nocardioides sp.]|jgi:hypothetical protein|uniref:hypothetical protein n=1 Tax=Nocardioides sp. TaxID=35761 RepID=UPI0031FE4FFA|nr:hypothetical protein [Nocardioides sp.]